MACDPVGSYITVFHRVVSLDLFYSCFLTLESSSVDLAKSVIEYRVRDIDAWMTVNMLKGPLTYFLGCVAEDVMVK